MQTSITLPFADGEYLFRLPIRQIIEIEGKAGFIDAVKNRLIHGGFGIQDVVEVIRHGLIGGGKGLVNDVTAPVDELRANSLVETYVGNKPLAISAQIAKQIVAALYVGYEPEGENPPKKDETQESRESSTGVSSSTTAEPAD